MTIFSSHGIETSDREAITFLGLLGQFLAASKKYELSVLFFVVKVLFHQIAACEFFLLLVTRSWGMYIRLFFFQ